MSEVMDAAKAMTREGSALRLVLKVLEEGSASPRYFETAAVIEAGRSALVGGGSTLFALNHGRGDHPDGWVLRDGSGTAEDPSISAKFTIRSADGERCSGVWHGQVNGGLAAGFFTAESQG